MKKILVLCTGNSCRSQILEGWLKTFSNGDYLVFSAGVEAHGINKDAVHYMNEVDIDLSNHTSDLIEKYCDIKFDLFVTYVILLKNPVRLYQTLQKYFTEILTILQKLKINLMHLEELY